MEETPVDKPSIPINVELVEAAVQTSFQLGVQYGIALASSNLNHADVRQQKGGEKKKKPKGNMVTQQSDHCRPAISLCFVFSITHCMCLSVCFCRVLPGAVVRTLAANVANQ